MVLYEYVENKDGKAIHISDAKRGEKYICMECSGIMVPKKGKIKEHHFAHNNDSDLSKHGNHLNESDLHKKTKNYIVGKLKELYENNKHLYFNVTCTKHKDADYIFNDLYYGTHLNKVQVEKNIKPDLERIKYNIEYDNVLCEKQTAGKYIPDISLMKNGALNTVIEIIHTHEDTEEKTEWYRENKINVISIEVKSENDYKKLKSQFRISWVNTFKIPSIFNMELNKHCGVKLVITKDMLINNYNVRKRNKNLSELLYNDNGNSIAEELIKEANHIEYKGYNTRTYIYRLKKDIKIEIETLLNYREIIKSIRNGMCLIDKNVNYYTNYTKFIAIFCEVDLIIKDIADIKKEMTCIENEIVSLSSSIKYTKQLYNNKNYCKIDNCNINIAHLIIKLICEDGIKYFDTANYIMRKIGMYSLNSSIVNDTFVLLVSEDIIILKGDNYRLNGEIINYKKVYNK